MNTFPEPDAALDLVLSTRQFAMLINNGTTLVRSLLIMEQEAQPTLGNVWHAVRLEIEQGQTLSSALRQKPEIFTPFYTAMARAGEVGGVLDETMSRTADMLEEEWEFSRLMELGARTSLLLPPVGPACQEWGELTEFEQKLTLLLLCRAWSLLLSSGVPIIHTLQIAAELLPATQRAVLRDDVVHQLREGEPLSEALAAAGFLPPLVIELWRAGEENGSVDIAMDKAAQFYRYELACRLGFVAGNPALAERAPVLATQVGRPRLAEMEEALAFFTNELGKLGIPATAPEAREEASRALWGQQITPLANRLLQLAIALRATEIQFEWIRGTGRIEDAEESIYFRIDGTLREIKRVSAFLASQLHSHITVMAGIHGRLRKGYIYLRHEGVDYALLVSRAERFSIVIEVRDTGH